MPLESPNLDNRTYKEIIEQAKKLIPRYAPGWTDWNESDPGITLIELFAWMTEMILFRLNQVPDKNFIEFLKLVGIELKPAEPAKADLTFTLAEGVESTVIPEGTQVGPEVEGEEESIIFETEEALIALGIELADVQSYAGGVYTPYTEANNQAGSHYYPAFGDYANEGSTLLLGFSYDNPFPETEVKLTITLYEEDIIAQGSHCRIDQTGIYSNAQLAWEYWNGSAFRPLEVIKDRTRSLSQSGSIFLKGTGLLKKSKQGNVQDKDLYWIRCRVLEAGYEIPPRIDTILLNTVSAQNAVTMKDEVLGSSNGTPGQVFTLSNNFIIDKTLILQVDEGDGWETWKEVDDFYASTRDDSHYMLNRFTGEITFGNGENGRIPLPHPGGNNIMALEYRYGGGERGNLGSGTITELEDSLPYVESVTNKRPATGGRDEETLDEVKVRGPMELKTRHRAVTPEDFEFLAKETPGVRIRRAKALPCFHPGFPGCAVPGAVTIIIVPESKDPKPMPGEGTIKTVYEHLNKHRLLTTEVCIIPPEYVKMTVEAEVIVHQNADAASAANILRSNLNTFFHPLTGGLKGEGWPFGGDIYYSDVYKIILDTTGIERIETLILYKDDQKQDECQNIGIPGNCLLYSGIHKLDVRYRRE